MNLFNVSLDKKCEHLVGGFTGRIAAAYRTAKLAACSWKTDFFIRRVSCFFLASVLLFVIGRPCFSIETAKWAEPGRAGVNCLYALLRMLEVECQYSELASALEPSPMGSSLADLAAVGRRKGADIEAVKVTPEEIRRLPPPYILHLDTVGHGDLGHYVTVFLIFPYGDGIDDIEMRYLDGANGLITGQSASSLLKDASGYLIVPRDARPIPPYARLIVTSMMFAVPFCILIVIHVLWNERTST